MLVTISNDWFLMETLIIDYFVHTFAETLEYTPGKLGSAQPIPQLTIPTRVFATSSYSGPPLSPWQESFPPSVAHIMLPVMSPLL